MMMILVLVMMIRRFVGRKQVVAANEELELASIHLQHLRLYLD